MRLWIWMIVTAIVGVPFLLLGALFRTIEVWFEAGKALVDKWCK